MSVTLVLPAQLRDLTGERGTLVIDVPPRTVRGALEVLRDRHPFVYDRILTEQRDLRPHVNVFANGEDIRFTGGLDTPLRDGGEVLILPSVSGG